jgi:hypothetical protein
MTAVWPATITIHQLSPVSTEPVEMRHVFQPEQGEPMTAPAATGQVYHVRFDVLMSGQHLRNDFLAWWSNELQQGSQPFTGLEDVVTDGAATYQFVDQSPPSFALLRAASAPADRIWRTSFDLWKTA